MLQVLTTRVYVLKARSHDPFLRIRFLIPKTGSRRPDGPICGENVGRSLVVCSHYPFFELTKNLQFGAKTIMPNLSVPFIFHRECRMKIEHVLFPSVFFKITDPFDGKSFLMCSHDPFFGTNKDRILKNGSCERAFTLRSFWSNLSAP